MEFVVAPIAELRSHLTHAFEETVGETLDRGNGGADEAHTFACALTGGSTALIFLGALREADVNWSNVALYWGDERAVPPDHPDSNFGLAERLLLTPLGARAPRAIRMPADMENLDAAARSYDLTLAQAMRALDLIILGIGEDGHVCSLFPGHRALMIDGTRVVAIEDAPKPPPRRLSLSLEFVIAARRVWVVAVGPRKLPVLEAAVAGNQMSTPLDLVVRQAKRVTVFTDQALRRR